MENPFKPYMDKYSEARLWKKVQHYSRQAGLKVVYTALLLFHAYRRRDTPPWAKRIVIGALGYFISPIDLVPDLTPIIGYTDDLGVLAFGLVTIAAYVNDEVRQNAKAQLRRWFGDYDERDLAEVDDAI